MIGIALRRLGTAIVVVAGLALAANYLLRVSRGGATESTGYIVYYLEENGAGVGLFWFAVSTLTVWASLFVLAGRSVGASHNEAPAHVRESAEAAGGAESAEGPPVLPEWLEEKASEAPTMLRVLMEAVDLRLQREHPRVLLESNWGEFTRVGTVGGCVALALRLHVDVPQRHRTSLVARTGNAVVVRTRVPSKRGSI